jgi:3D (Asp-Asp-Asp) domain-containing protein
MSKPLLGGSVAIVTLLSASLIFHAEPSVAEPLAQSASGTQSQQKGETAAVPAKTDGDAAVTTAESTAKTETSTVNTTVEERAPAKPDAAKPVEGPVDIKNEAEPTVHYVATAYSLRGRTASGKHVSRGLIAADRRVLPIGTRVRLDAGAYSGDYLVADTGGSVRGKKIDIWMPSTREAMRFGRRKVKLTVLTRVPPRTRKRA